MDMYGCDIVRKRIDEMTVVPWAVTPVDIRFCYWPLDNVITNERGEIVYDIFKFITPNDLILFKGNPFWNQYFVHVENPELIVGISYQDPEYYEPGDYKRYPTAKTQLMLREREIARFDNQEDNGLDNFEFRRKIYPELYLEEE